MIADRYIQAVREGFDQIETERRPVIEEAAAIIADKVAQGGLIHLYDTGHIVDSEIYNRAGGMPLFRRLRFNLNVENAVPARRVAQKGQPGGPSGGFTPGIGKLALHNSNIGPNDVVIMGSVSGKSPNLVDMALALKDAGIFLIALTAPAYSSKLAAEHPSGKKLYELGDLLIDNGAPYGDAMIEHPDLPNRFGPASGLNAAYIMWILSACLIEELLARGITPTVFGSINRTGGPEDYHAMVERFETLGH